MCYQDQNISEKMWVSARRLTRLYSSSPFIYFCEGILEKSYFFHSNNNNSNILVMHSITCILLYYDYCDYSVIFLVISEWLHFITAKGIASVCISRRKKCSETTFQHSDW